MSLSHQKPLVLVVGATGRTGSPIVKGLVDSGAFRVAAVSRKTTNPIIDTFRAQGVEIRTGDIDNDSVESLTNLLQGVDILVSAARSDKFTVELRLFDAAKAAGVSRVVPNEWGPYAPEGAILIHDKKIAVREYIRKLGLTYTFIVIGWWIQGIVPYPTHPLNVPPVEDYPRVPVGEIVNVSPGSGDVKVAVIDVRNLGKLVARILADDRTVNQTVFAAEGEVTLNEVWEVAARFSEDQEALVKKRVKVADEEAKARLAAARAAHQADGTLQTLYPRVLAEYSYSLYIQGDNTRVNAVRSGALDLLELYPDYSPLNLEEYVKEFYARD